MSDIEYRLSEIRKRVRLNNIVIFVCIFFSVVCWFAVQLTGILAVSDPVQIGPVFLPLSSVRGLLTAIINLLCFIIVCCSYKVGLWFGTIIMGVSTGSMVMSIVRTHDATPLPGLISNISTIIILYIIAFEIRRVYKDSITDILTGLYNRRGFAIRVDKYILKKKNKKFHILYIRLKDIRAIIDEHGHEYVDDIICQIGTRLKNLVGLNGQVAKLDGREFAVAINDTMDPIDTAEKIIDTIYKKITVTIDDAEMDFNLSSYVGIASYPDTAKDSAGLIRFSGIAAFNAINSPDKSYCMYEDEMVEDLHHCAEMEKTIKHALENKLFYLMYQPQFTSAEKKLRGFESLIRLKDEEGNFIPPSEFIPIAENTDLILRIDDYVLNMAMEQFAMQFRASEDKLILSVNVSAKNMASSDFVDRVLDIINKTSFPPENLEIEITEYSFAMSMDQTVENVMRLKENSIQVALDDFGTGYTSLSQLLKLPISVLKIDKSLIDDIVTNQTNCDFVDAIIYMGHLMDCEVISEGVEYLDQLNILKEHECDFIQGFIWSKPIEYNDALALTKE